MNKATAALSATVLASSSWCQTTLAADSAVGTARPANLAAAPVDFRACTFREGKTREDLDAVATKFRDYASANELNYAAWILVPQYHSQSDFDIGWLGAWPDGESFGVSMEQWMSGGGELQAEFAEVMDCSNHHELAMSLPVNAADSTPQDGIMMAYECNLEEGKNLDAAYAAHLEWGSAKKALGFLDNSWMFQPAAGIRDIDFDYYYIVVFYRYSDLGAAMQIFANGGGMQQREAIYSGVTDCSRPFIYDFRSVIDRDEG